MEDNDQNAIINLYENLVLIGVVYPTVALVMLVPKSYYGDIIDKFKLATIMIAAILALVLAVAVAIASYRKNHCFPWEFKYFKTFVYSLLVFPVFGIVVLMGTNCYFDNSSPVARTAVIVEKSESHSARKGRKQDYYFVYVQSWKSGVDKIRVEVQSDSFAYLNVGDYITVNTKRGLLGLEWLTSNN